MIYDSCLHITEVFDNIRAFNLVSELEQAFPYLHCFIFFSYPKNRFLPIPYSHSDVIRSRMVLSLKVIVHLI